MFPQKIAILCLVLSGCSGIHSTGEDDGFYTWVDERGQLHTRKKPSVTSTKPAESLVSNSEATAKEDNPSKLSNPSSFNPSDFTPSTDIEKKLAGAGLLAWQEAGYNHSTTYSKQVSEAQEQRGESLEGFSSDRFALDYREGRDIPFTSIESRTLKLERHYQFGDKAQTDYVLIDLGDTQISSPLVFKTFIQKNKAAMPSISFLRADYLYLNKPVIPFQDYSPETWTSYGYFFGVIKVPAGSRYILITPTKEAGVIEVGEQVFGMKDLGELEIYRGFD